MKIVPLNDKIVVERLEADDKTAGGIILPDTAKEKPKQGKMLRRGRGQAARRRQAGGVPGEGRRPRAVHLLRRQRGQPRGEGIPHHDRGRHPRRRGLSQSRQGTGVRGQKPEVDTASRSLTGRQHPARVATIDSGLGSARVRRPGCETQDHSCSHPLDARRPVPVPDHAQPIFRQTLAGRGLRRSYIASTIPTSAWGVGGVSGDSVRVSTCSSRSNGAWGCRHTGNGGSSALAWLRTSTSATCPGPRRRTTCTRCSSSTGRSPGPRWSPTGRPAGPAGSGSSRCPTRRRPTRPSPP